MFSTASRKAIAAFVVGAFILGGITIPLIAQAEATTEDRPAHHQKHRKLDPEQTAKRLSTEFGLDESLISKYQQEGKNDKDLYHAAFYAKVSGQSFESVLALKTETNTWKDVADTLGIDKEQAKAVRQELAAKRISLKYGLNQEDIQNLFNQGYQHRDIAMAGLLAKQSNQAIEQVMSMKKVNNTWHDVAAELGIDLKALKQEAGRNKHNPKS
ncbi:hypothetical protein [Sporomusa termitida]|uniref:Uncharacterized protein n=1 Tax=Sporomusa termitida TaxID=2377 RepID=A0A517E190_9FIRM|nr:hypothetical protein [Sporomusa termitida]QDR83370.1 hypothetical protein SPTER_48540 [Sporomusa termitida]